MGRDSRDGIGTALGVKDVTLDAEGTGDDTVLRCHVI